MRSSSPTLNVPTSLAIRILTHNIRYATTSPFPGELPWADRKAGLVSELLYHTRHCPAAIICLQEVLHEQLVDVLTGLNGTRSEWSYVGVGRDDGRQAGEFAPIIYRSQVLHLERYYTMWLSPTPWVPGSKGWDAASVRILTVAKLRHRESGAIVWAMNTHLDDQGAVSRREGAKMIVRTAKEVMVEGDVDIAFLAGDLNSETSGEAYRVLNEEGSGLVDLERLVERGYGDEMTFTGFNGHGDGEGRTTKIDFIHLSTKALSGSESISRHVQESTDAEKTRWGVQGYAVLPNRFEDGIYISDHRAVVGDVVLPSKS